MGDSLLDRIEDVTGRLSNRRHLQLDVMPTVTLEGWVEEFRGLCGGDYSMPPKGSGYELRNEIRPYLGYIPWSIDKLHRDRAGSNGLQSLITRVMRELLYCHSVAVDDPLTKLVDHDHFPARESEFYPRTPSPDEIQLSLEFLAVARPLIKAGLIVLMASDLRGLKEWWYRGGNGHYAPEWYADVIGRPPPDGDYWFGMRNVPVSILVDRLLTNEMKQFVSGTSKELERVPMVDAIDLVYPKVYKFVKTRGAVDFNFDASDSSLYGIATMETLAQEAGVFAFQKMNQSLDDSRLKALIEIDAPSFDTLSFEDLIRLHSDSEVFLNWRIALGQALDMVLVEGGREGRVRPETRQRFNEALYPALAAMKADAPSLRSMSLDALQSIIVGSIPVAIGMLTQSPGAGFIAAGASSAATFAWTYSATTRKRRIHSIADTLSKEP